MAKNLARIAYYAGSFDPVTNGHLDVVRRAARMADTLVLAIGVHPGKTPLFTTEERLAMLEQVCGPVARKAGCKLVCTTFSGLVIEAARKAKATLLIRGLRDTTDFNYEMQMAGMNEAMAPRIQTVFRRAPLSARSPPHWCARSPACAATCRPSCRRRSRRGSRKSFAKSFPHAPPPGGRPSQETS